MSSICLNILYKSLNPSLIDKMENIYSKNFNKIFHLMPLYSEEEYGKKENVIPVFENKYQLTGHIAQAYEKIYQEKYDYYVFMTDECLLSPCVNQDNLKEIFKLDKDTCFISSDIKAVDVDVLNDTNWAFPSLFNMTYNKNGAEIIKFIPSKANARKLYTKNADAKTPYIYADYFSYLQKHIVANRRHNHPFFFELKHGQKDIKTLSEVFVSKLEQDKLKTIYPFVCSQAEFFIVPSCSIKNFKHYCGLLGSVRLHYNIGFATSMCFSANEKIKMPKDYNEGIKILDLKQKNYKGQTPAIKLIEKDKVLIDDNQEETLVAYPVSLDKVIIESCEEY